MLRSMILATATLVLAAQTPAPEPAKPETTAAAPAVETPKPAEAAPAPAPAAEAAPEPAKAAKATKAAKAAKPAKPADPVLAVIGKESVRQSDFELFLDTALNQQQRMQVQFVEGARDQYLKQYLEYRTLAAKARKEGLQKQPGHARKLAIMEMQLLIQSLMERDGAALQAKAAVKDEDVKAYFTAHPDKFRTPETFNARHILIGTRANGDKKALTEEEAKAKADKVLAEIKGGKSFADAAKEYSDDPGSKDKGGLYEDTPFGRFVPEFDEAVRKQAIGQVGEPVKTMFGYHLIEVEKITPAAAQTFEQVKDDAREQVASERQDAVMQGYIDGARNEVGFRAGAPAGGARPAKKAKKAAQ
jgi:peptidyl-prolyl cis-trans isomerase C